MKDGVAIIELSNPPIKALSHDARKHPYGMSGVRMTGDELIEGRRWSANYRIVRYVSAAVTAQLAFSRYFKHNSPDR